MKAFNSDEKTLTSGKGDSSRSIRNAGGNHIGILVNTKRKRGTAGGYMSSEAKVVGTCLIETSTA